MAEEYTENLSLSDKVSVPESMIKIMCNSHAEENNQHMMDERNPYFLLLQEGYLYKMAGLTPVYLCFELKNFEVTSLERLQQEYH